MTLLFEDIPHASTLLQLNATLFSFDYIWRTKWETMMGSS
jgi:hypothetical protein